MGFTSTLALNLSVHLHLYLSTMKFALASAFLLGAASANLRPTEKIVTPKVTTLLPYLSAAASSHYEDPKPNGCRSDEQAIQIQGVSGDFCTPKCSGMTCPSDVPSGVTATPTCALQDTSGNKYCALICSPTQNDACGTNASCKSISGVGICTYDD